MAHPGIEGSFDPEPEPKRRKVRKGTLSCWECKRRKIRCTFAAPLDAICDGCKRRGTTCISQEFPDEPSCAKQLGDRLGRVEAVIEQLAGKTKTYKELSGSSTSASKLRKHSNGDDFEREEHQARTAPTRNPPSEEMSRYHDLTSQLVAAWPSQHDLDLILSLPTSVTGLLQNFTCSPYFSSPGQDAPSPRDMLQLPPGVSHPVLVTRKLLLLGSFLQGIRPCYQHVDGLSVSFRDTIMSRVVDTARNLVTSNDDLVDSVEGIECLMIESMYHNNSGNLRRSWLVIRRAMLMAQLMGLHRDVQLLASLKVLERDTQADISPPRMWFRLVQMERYLSLMLGLPLGSPDNDFASPKALEGCTKIERMQRLQCVAGGRILQRDQAGMDDLTSTHEIDMLLYEASSLMPSKWWLPPTAGDTANTFDETVRIMNLFTHHYMLLRLHLPYLLRFSADQKYDYSKITGVNASREILSLFVPFRRSNPATPYCRGVDFLVFTASTVLCIAHIEGRRQRHMYEPCLGDPGGGTFFKFLSHQRLADRGMMECALEIMEAMAHDGTDKIASKIASILRHLLDIEADAAAGGTYNTNTSRGDPTDRDEEGLGCNGNLSDSGNVLRIYIPYFGNIKIERGGIYKSGLPVPVAPGLDSTILCGASVPLEHRDEDQRQSKHPKNTPTGYQVNNHPESPDWQAVPCLSGSVVPSEQPASNPKDNSACGSPTTNDAQLFVPGLAATIDDWALQGVDTAFFDSLLSGQTEEELPM